MNQKVLAICFKYGNPPVVQALEIPMKGRHTELSRAQSNDFITCDNLSQNTQRISNKTRLLTI